MAELADISVGDAWAPTYESRGGGWSVVVARTQKGLDILERMRDDGAINLQEVSEEELIRMHSHGLDLKKRGAFLRIERRRKNGLPVPEYGYRPINIPASRKRFEDIVGMLFSVFRWPVTIWILEQIPIPIIGWFFIRARNAWKKTTKPTKRKGLSELRFVIDPPVAH
jgi:coenzyme F420 hydrogenase subunit beta